MEGKLMAEKQKLYYVTGKDDAGNKRTVKTYASDPAGARWNAGYILATPGRVKLG